MTVMADPILPGSACGKLVVLEAPISFWGGVRPDTGTIADVFHPQRGLCLAGRVVWLPELKGSGGTPGAIASLIRAGLGPAAILMPGGDANLLVGLMVAQKLYERCVPYLKVKRPPNMQAIEISLSGKLKQIDGAH